MYSRLVNYVRIGEKFGMDPFEVSTKWTMQQVDVILGIMTEDTKYQEQQNKKRR